MAPRQRSVTRLATLDALKVHGWQLDTDYHGGRGDREPQRRFRRGLEVLYLRFGGRSPSGAVNIRVTWGEYWRQYADGRDTTYERLPTSKTGDRAMEIITRRPGE